jgi:NAD(P)H-hydrate epimerase
VKPLADVATIQTADAEAAAAGIPVATLMRRAGRAVALAAVEVMGGASGRRVVALAGRGNNGGDAMEAAAQLARRGAGAEVLLTSDPERLGDEARRTAALVRDAGARVRVFEPQLARRLLGDADVVLDGILGTGSSGAPRGLAAAAISAANAAAAPVVAVDIPSGVDGSTGEVAAEAIGARVTVTFQALKPGHVLPPGSSRAGRVEVADIGLPLAQGLWGVSEASDLMGLVPVPRAETHKRSRGVLLAIGGSTGMGGAPTLMGRAARRAGAGLLVLAVPGSIAERVGAAVPEALTVALPDGEGGITPAAVDACKRWLDEATALAIGPGLGRTQGTQEAVRGLLAAFQGRAVVDADGLFALGTGEPLVDRRNPTLLTPHAGEFARLDPSAEGTRLEAASGLARRVGATVLLKGNDTVIVDPSGRLVVNPTGTPVLASGGTGDVLTGLTGALLAQGLDPFDAGRLGAWVHGRAGAIASGDLSPVSVAAGDVADHLPAAFRELLARTGAPAGAAGGRPAWLGLSGSPPAGRPTQPTRQPRPIPTHPGIPPGSPGPLR